MTAEEWESCTDQHDMLLALPNGTSDRKLRLFAIWCYRYRFPDTSDAEFAVVDALERRLDGDISDTEWFETYSAVGGHGGSRALQHLLAVSPLSAARQSATFKHLLGTTIRDPEIRERDRLTAQNMLREVFGNPFRPVVPDPTWLTSDVLLLVRGIYDERAFDRMPILADALQDAGCDNEEVLSHCRGTGPHVRGCWVVDLLLGKA